MVLATIRFPSSFSMSPILNNKPETTIKESSVFSCPASFLAISRLSEKSVLATIRFPSDSSMAPFLDKETQTDRKDCGVFS